MSFPQTRLRRLRQNSTLRSMIQESHVSIDDLIMPLFIVEGSNIKKPITSMPGNYQMSIDNILKETEELWHLGVKSVLLFGIPAKKDEHGHVACTDTSIVPKAIRAIKEQCAQMLVVADVCNCEYTTHGHCGTVVEGDVHNDSTIETLARQSVVLAKSGADIIAPSDMMDGRVGKIRAALDEAGYFNTPIMSYAAKYASAYYGPFRDAAESAPQFGDRKTYQMDPANSNEAMREIELDILEGADMVMVKPALSYLDIIRRAKDSFNIPLVAYNVSGEFSMVKAAAANGWIDEKRVVMETLLSMKRAGADIIISYHTKDVAGWLST
ncbi:MAG: porphobilinogen synthase [Bacteroidales bacterium]|nr:porphobilinogen synthase [Bacteroidales bacterium]